MKHLQTSLRVLLVMACMLTSALAWAQVKVTGLVIDEQHEPIIGASVLVKGSSLGTTTGIDGQFSITAPSAQSELVISYVGCLSVTVHADDPSLKTGIVLHTDAELLDEVVVIGYGTVKKSDATGSLTAIKPDNLNRGAAITPQDALIGKIAGVHVVSAGGAPGSDATMRIRTGSSLSASNDPLIVVDGVPLSNASISDINPNDIETFTVLKDASATAIYGSRASNGVIVITTKKGHGHLQVEYSGNFTVSHTTKRIEVLTADEYRDIIHTIPGIPSDVELGTANTDWQSEIYRTAVGTDHNVALSGDIKNTSPYRLSFGYSNQEGVIKTNRYERYTGALSLNPSLLNKHLTLNLNANISYSRDNSVTSGVVSNAIIFDPTRAPKTGSPTASTDPGLGYFVWTNGGAPMAIQTDNPLAQIELDDRLTAKTRSIGSAQVNYKVHGFEDLKVNLNLGYDVYKSDYTRHVPDLAGMMYTANQKDGRGLDENSVSKKRNYLLDFYLNYGHNWANKHEFNVMAGYGWQHFWNNSKSTDKDLDGNDFSTPTHSESEYYLLSYYGRLNYSFDNRFLLTATMRADASSRFAKENRWGYFPSVAAAWRVINEEIFKGQNVLSDFKIRVSYGVTGQQEISNDYPWMTTFTVSYPEAMYQFGDEWYRTYRPNGYDRDIKWETTSTWNYGIDYGFLNNRLFGSVDYYRRHTKDLLNNINVPSGVNYAPIIYTNIGSMDNEGVEVALNAVLVQGSDFDWSVGFNYTWQKSKITKLNVVDSDQTYVETGTLTSRKFTQVFMVGQTPYTYYLAKQAYDADGNPLEGQYIQADGSIGTTETRHISKHSALPSSLLGFNTQLHYKNWELSVAGHGMLGNYVFNYVKADQHLTSAYSDQGYFNNLMRSTVEMGFENEQLASDIWLEDGSFFRIDNITLGYTFPRLWNTSSRLRITAAVNNVYTFTHYSGLDPEVYSGIDKNIYPRPRTFSVGVNLNF